MQLFLLMKDYGRDGREAICDPEETRAGIVSEVRDTLARGTVGIAFIKFIDGNYVEDVTEEIINEARAGMEPEECDHQSARWDHARDLRKNYVEAI